MLIRNAEIYGEAGLCCVRITQGRVTELGALALRPGERLLDAAGGALLPGLNDHHLHLMSLAAAAQSAPCGPPDVTSVEALIAQLRAHQDDGQGWVRGVGYHDSVAGAIDRAWLDAHGGAGPIRIQHRSGRLWIVNSAALELIATAQERLPPAQRPALADDGRLYDLDPALHLLAAADPPDVDTVSRQLAAYGVTGITDMTPANDAESAQVLAAMQRDGRLRQHVRLAGTEGLSDCTELARAANPESAAFELGATKVHLHETHLPEFDALSATIAASHAQGREVAVHCVTEVELVFALAAFRAAGVSRGDRLEHASLTPPELLAQIRDLGLLVCTQPNFVGERGDAYLTDIAAAEHPWLYRCGSFLANGIPLAGGTDAPFGHADPWRAMSAAVNRLTPSGNTLGAEEALTPEQALALFLGELGNPSVARHISPGVRADLCLLDRPWRDARGSLCSSHVRATVRAGELIFDGVDESPVEGNVG